MTAAKGERLPPSFNRLAWSNLAAQSADQIALAAAPIVAVLSFGAGEGIAGLMQTLLTLPFILFAIPAGVLADRMSRRGLMAGAEAVRAIALLAILALIWFGALTLPMLIVLGFITVCGTIAYSVGAPSLVPALVPPSRLAAANGRIELARTVAFAAGPAIGGALVGWIGAAPAFGLAAALSVIATVLLANLHEPARQPAPRRKPLLEITEGARFVYGHALLLPIMVTQVVFNIAIFIILAVFVPYAVRHLGLSASAIGVTLGMYGGGMVIGAMLAARVMRRLPFGTVVAIGPICGLCGSIVMALTIYFPSIYLAAFSFFMLGVGPILWVISTMTIRQAVTPPRLLGRVFAISILTQGARPIGAAIGAIVGGSYGAEVCLYLAVAVFFAQMMVILLSPVVRLTQQPDMVGDNVAEAAT